MHLSCVNGNGSMFKMNLFCAFSPTAPHKVRFALTNAMRHLVCDLLWLHFVLPDPIWVGGLPQLRHRGCQAGSFPTVPWMYQLGLLRVSVVFVVQFPCFMFPTLKRSEFLFVFLFVIICLTA